MLAPSDSKEQLSNQNPSNDQSQDRKQPLALPEVSQSDNAQIDMSSGGGTAKLDALGPMVVNVDGTLSRITNWDKMTEFEQKNTLRIIGKRNKERLARLKAERGEGGGDGEEVLKS